MARTIEFDVEALIGKLDVLQKVQLPYAGNRALWALKPKLRGALQDEMRSRFRAPVPLTLNSPFLRIDGLEMTVSIKPDKVAKGIQRSPPRKTQRPPLVFEGLIVRPSQPGRRAEHQ